jgi:hypothetical protein
LLHVTTLPQPQLKWAWPKFPSIYGHFSEMWSERREALPEEVKGAFGECLICSWQVLLGNMTFCKDVWSGIGGDKEVMQIAPRWIYHLSSFLSFCLCWLAGGYGAAVKSRFQIALYSWGRAICEEPKRVR